MWITGVCFLTIATITVAMDVACKKPPISDYDSSMGCCKNSVITYTDDAMDYCKKYNTSNTPSNKDLFLRNLCEIQCYLKYSGLIGPDGSVIQNELVNFLRENLQSDEVNTLLSKLTNKCLFEIEQIKYEKNFDANCQPYYGSLIDCIQGEIFINCPERLNNPSEKCAATRLFVRYCGMEGLRKMFGQPNAGDEDSDEDSSLEYEDSESDQSESESESESSESSKTESDSEYSESEYSGSEYSASSYESDSDSDTDSHSDSDSDSDSDYDSESESSGDDSMELTTASRGRH